jgi:hypothetical protein
MYKPTISLINVCFNQNWGAVVTGWTRCSILILILLLLFELGPQACFTSELFWNCGSYRPALSNAAPTGAMAPVIYFSGTLRKHIQFSRFVILIQIVRHFLETLLFLLLLLLILLLLLVVVVVGVVLRSSRNSSIK